MTRRQSRDTAVARGCYVRMSSLKGRVATDIVHPSRASVSPRPVPVLQASTVAHFVSPHKD